MKIHLTTKQYKDLLRLLLLGDWIVNSNTIDEENMKFREIQRHIFSFTKSFATLDRVSYDTKLNDFFPSRKLEEEVQPYIDEYNDDNFWTELSYRLSSRDLAEEIGKENYRKMDPIKRVCEIDSRAEDYNRIFEAEGIGKLKMK